MMYFTLRNINLAFGDHFILRNSSFTLPNSVSNDRILFLKFEYSFTNGCSDEVAIANDARDIRQGAVIKEDAVGQLTMMMPNKKEQCLKEYEWL